ncbi:MAG: hypothetical protein O3C57_05205 [Verrucomicrobia bacterium]|nr:hypothetical protein [Verrucomicrobiota bacterium]
MRTVNLVKTGLALVLGVTTTGHVFAADGDRVKIDVELPKPMFIGTPKDLKTSNLEAPRKGPRRPLMAPAGTENVAAGKAVTSSDMFPIIGEFELAVDGDKEGSDGSYMELGPGVQHVQINLGAAHIIHGIVIWHFHSQARVYHDVIVQIADDEDFITNVRTVFNNDHDNSAGMGIGEDKEYIETFEGLPISVRAENGQFVRLYSNGSTSGEMNHYIEVEVYGQPVE